MGAIEASSPLQAVSRNPIVLKVRRYPHGCDHAHHEHPHYDRAIDDACSATILQTKITGQQGVLPCRLEYRHKANDADEFEIALFKSKRFARIFQNMIWESYTQFLGLAHSRHLALIFVSAAFQLDGSLVFLHLVQRSVIRWSDVCVE